jgi:hypothetical protein
MSHGSRGHGSAASDQRPRISTDLHGSFGGLLGISLLTTERILGEYYKVFNELRFGFREAIYQGAMAIALTQAGLTVQEQVPMRKPSTV